MTHIIMHAIIDFRGKGHPINDRDLHEPVWPRKTLISGERPDLPRACGDGVDSASKSGHGDACRHADDADVAPCGCCEHFDPRVVCGGAKYLDFDVLDDVAVGDYCDEAGGAIEKLGTKTLAI